MIAIVRVARALDFAARELAVLRDADFGRRLGRVRRVAEPLKRGDLYFVKPPGFVGKVRPAVIVQADKYNAAPRRLTP